MTKNALDTFVEEVMSINSDYPGMGGASAGIIGASGTSHQVVSDTRKSLLAFAAEYKKQTLDQGRLTELAEQLEGSLYSLKMISAISDERLEKLVTDLHGLVNDAGSA